VVHVVTADLTASACPNCGVLSVCLKGRVCTPPRDIPNGTRVLRLIWHKRRWRCKERLCPGTRSASRCRQCGPLDADDAATDRARVRDRQTGLDCLGIRYPLRHGPLHRARPAHGPRPGPRWRRRCRRWPCSGPIWTQDPHTKRRVLACDRWHTGLCAARRCLFGWR
jgi:hypothetical protein